MNRERRTRSRARHANCCLLLPWYSFECHQRPVKKLVRTTFTTHLLVDLCLFRGIAKSKQRQVQESVAPPHTPEFKNPLFHRIRLSSIVHERPLTWVTFLHIHAYRSFVSIMFPLYIHGHYRGCKLALHCHSRGPVVLSLNFQ